MTAQELLDALNKAQDETGLDQVAVWALSEYLQRAWKDIPGRNIRPFDLGKALSDFYVDLSQHRLPEKITKQTPQTETQLRKFFGAAGGGLSQFWAQCVEIWSVALEPYPAVAKEVKKYFDMLLQSSLPGKRPESAAAPVEPPAAFPMPAAPELPAEPLAPAAAEPVKRPEQAQIPAPTASENVPVTPTLAPASKDEPGAKVSPRNAYLVLQGTRVIPLNQPFIKIGRQLDNHIILEDPRVSRAHAQIKLINDRFVIFDLNSTGGTFVNGQPTSQSVLYPGDVVSLAGVVFIFSQEMPAKPGDVKIIELGSPFAADRPTAVVHREEIKPLKETGTDKYPDLPKTGPLK